MEVLGIICIIFATTILVLDCIVAIKKKKGKKNEDRSNN